MSHLVFPRLVAVRVHVWSRAGHAPYRGPALAFSVRTFARAKNDYELGPFFTNAEGVLAITRRELELAAAAQLSSGVMDYDAIGNAFSLIEISHWSSADIERAIDARSTIWTGELEGEAELYGSVDALVDRLRATGNASLQAAQERYGRLRDEWDGSLPVTEYEYSVSPATSA